MSTALAALSGAGVGAGLALLLIALYGAGHSRRWPAGPARRTGPSVATRRRLLACGGVGLAAGVGTRWPVGALLGMLLAWWWPALFGANGAV